ncbi:MAG: organomercurial lyase [Actinomycetota bacterium]|nr:organomercurial lyase [Actinomycetota bacterium]
MASDLERLAREVTAALPSLDLESRAVGLAVYRLLAAGTAATPAAIAANSKMPAPHVAALLTSLPTASLERGEVTAFLGLQREPGQHQITCSAPRRGAWCAWDTLFLPALVGTPARVESRCPVSGTLVRMVVDPRDGVREVSPAGTVLSFLDRPAPYSGAVQAEFCRWIHFLAGDAEAEAWINANASGNEPPPMVALSLAEGVELGRRTNAMIFGASR